MDRITASRFRVLPPNDGAEPLAESAGTTPPAPTHRAGDPQCPAHPATTKARLLPPAAPAPSPTPPTLDAQRIGQSTLASAIGQGGCFGLCFSLLNHLRATSRNPALNGVAGLVLPPAFGYLTAPAQRAMFEALSFEPTQPRHRARWHEFIPSVAIYATNVTYAHLRCLPKPAPGTPAAAGVTLLLSATGTGLAGMLTEATAQWGGGKPEPLPDDDEVRRTGTGRALSLVPMGLANLRTVAYLTHANQVPSYFKMRPLQIGVVGWGFRKDVTPPPPRPTTADGVPHDPSPDHGG